ncbi:porin family protein [Sphingobacterium griseoflavum]|uniref:Outer membrane protein beta-barrel domain-containing protein n=1 Tax=Sphingobacterium griseoflavum TaxID=1474952 RepID=A0ABQ3HTI1_9SPHI|nr:porin family protein [Sphingobacterium griseoflavum]GHE23087.1 hypothetical protein GCM10017764_00550 [Sphingobacterium griseoflavum]
MKKILLSFGAALLLAAGAQAQSGLGYGLKAGVNFPSYSFGNSNDLSDTKSTTNFHVTGYLDAPVTQNFYIQPGVSLQGKGAKLVESSALGGSEVTQNTMWLEVPVNFVGKFQAGNGNFFVGAGPYIGFGLSGKNKYSTGSGSNVVEREFKFGKENTLKGTDFGVNFLAGYKLAGGFLINAGYGLGLTNIAGDNNWTNDIKNRVWTVGIGFEM